MKYFWKKKTIVTYWLSVFVFLIHISSFANYNSEGGFIAGLNDFVELLFKNVFTIFSVPLFFIISGVLFYRNYDKTMYLEKLKSRIKTLVIPFLIWNTIWMLFEIFTSYTFLSSYFIGREKYVLTIQNILNSIFHYGSNGPFWFVFELFFFIIITPIIDKITNNKYIGLFVALIILLLAEFDIGLPHPLFYSKEALSHYIIGSVIGKHYFEKFKNKSSSKEQLVSVVFTIFFSVYYFVCLSLNIEQPMFLKNFLIVFLSITFWNLMDLFVDKMKEYNFYSYSFAVFAMHINVSAVISKLLYMILPKTQYMVLPNFILTLIITLSLINLFCTILKSFLPKFYSLLMGSR